MCHVAAEMEREGFNTPLLIGGATTSQFHTAVKISPAYTRGQAIYVTDASRAVGVVSNLLGEGRAPMSPTSASDYARLKEAHERARDAKARTSLRDARANKFRIDWAKYAAPRPTFLGTRTFREYDLARLCRISTGHRFSPPGI